MTVYDYRIAHLIKRVYRARIFDVTSILLIYFQQHNRRYVSVMNECDWWRQREWCWQAWSSSWWLRRTERTCTTTTSILTSYSISLTAMKMLLRPMMNMLTFTEHFYLCSFFTVLNLSFKQQTAYRLVRLDINHLSHRITIFLCLIFVSLQTKR